jgi:tetratricopeptide (TPR) repeat protein
MLEALGYAAPSGSSGRTSAPDPRDAFEAHQDLVRARRLLRAGPSSEAEALLLRAEGFDPENADVLESLARCARASEDAAREEELLRKVVLLDPSRAMAWNNLGSLLVRARGDRAEAIECYTRAIEADSSLVEAWVNRGSTEVELGRPDAAIFDFDEAIRRDASFAWAHYGKAMALREKGDFEGVVLELKLALRADPSLAPARALLEELRRAAGGPAGGP